MPFWGLTLLGNLFLGGTEVGVGVIPVSVLRPSSRQDLGAWIQLLVTQSLPSFGKDHDKVEAAVGRDAVLTCTVHNIMHYRTAWIKMKKGIVIAMGDDVFTENPRITVHHSLTLDGEQAWVLTIKNVNMDDTGDYMCSLNTNTNLRKLYHLSVVVPPKIVDADTSTDVEVKEGEQVLLHCGASGKPDPSYKWRREDSSLIHTSGKTELMVVGRELVIPKALKEHAGAYLCIATNGVPPSVSKRILLTVRFRPLIQASASEVWVNLGSCVNLSCVVDAFPEPNMVWLKDLGEPITTVHRSDYHLHASSATQVQKHVTGLLYENSSRWIMTLTVEDVHEGDLLGYRCRANNSEGVAEARVVIYKIPPTTTTTTTTTSTTTIPTTKVTQQSGDGNLPWLPGIEDMVEGSGWSGRHTPSPVVASSRNAGKNGTAAVSVEEDSGGQHQQQRDPQDSWDKNQERKTYSYSGAGSDASSSSGGGWGPHSSSLTPLLLPLLLTSTLLHVTTS